MQRHARIAISSQSRLPPTARRMLYDLEDLLIRALDRGILGTCDGIMVVESIPQMHEELYGHTQNFRRRTW